MDDFDTPFDVIWLDIEHTEEKKYFTWDKNSMTDDRSIFSLIFSAFFLFYSEGLILYVLFISVDFQNPYQMQEKLASEGRKLVVIIDPHLKNDHFYFVGKEARERNFLIRNGDGNGNYEGFCWPGKSNYPNFLAENVRLWWSSFFTPEKYRGMMEVMFYVVVFNC
jgi:alpha 1,3-glucosidase